MSAEYQNGMRNPYGFPELPDPNEDLEGTVQGTPQVAHVAGGSYPTEGPGGLPVSAPRQTNGENFIQAPGPLGQAANAPPPPVAHEVSDPYPPSQQHNQPAPSAPARPELKTPSTADYIFQALAGALHGRASGALFGALAAPGMHRQDQQALKEKQYEFDIQDQERKQAQAFRMQPKPLTAEGARLSDIAQVNADPEVQKYRKMGGLGPVGGAEYDAGAARMKEEALAQGKPPTAPHNVMGEVVRGGQKFTIARDPATGKERWSQPTGESYLPPDASARADRADKKNQSDEDIQIAAKALAAGDLTAIKDITSMRGGERLRVYALAKTINPNFTVGELNRKIKTEESYTVGKDGQQIQSFGTFFEHAGEVKDVVDGIYQSASPLANKPINYWRKNMSGSPDYQRLMVSLEPVRKEFEGFLLGGRALYGDDRKRAEVILSDDSSPAQIKVAVQQMGKTAQDRFIEMNHRYRRVMGKDLEDAFSPEAQAGAAKIGVSIGGIKPSGGQTPQSGQGAAPGAGVAAAGQQPKFSKMSTSGKFGWDGAKWVPVSQ